MSAKPEQGTAQQDQSTAEGVAAPRRRLLAAAALAPVLAGVGAGAARAASPASHADPALRPAAAPVAKPVRTTEADWEKVAQVLGRKGRLLRNISYHTGFPRTDLNVRSYGVNVTPGLAVGSHMAFIRYDDDSFMIMGDLAVTERELQRVCDALHAHGIEQTALHKHLLAHSPDIWWTHIHGHGRDALALARGLRIALDRTSTPPAKSDRPPIEPVQGLDTKGIDAALGIKGASFDGVYKAVYARRETIVDGGMELPSGLGATSAFSFQPLGGGRAALAGDCVMVASEVHDVLTGLRRGGINLVELHNHSLTDEPRLFFVHFWAVDDAVELARALRPVIDATNVRPIETQQ